MVHVHSHVHVHDTSVRIALGVPSLVNMAADHEVSEAVSVIAEPVPLVPINDLVVVIEGRIVGHERLNTADFRHHIIAVSRDSVVGVVVARDKNQPRIEKGNQIARMFALVTVREVANVDQRRAFLRPHIGVGNEALLAVVDILVGTVAETDDFLVSKMEVGSEEGGHGGFLCCEDYSESRRQVKPQNPILTDPKCVSLGCPLYSSLRTMIV